MSVWVVWEADTDGVGSADFLQEGRGVPRLCAGIGWGLAEKRLSSAHTLGQLGPRAHLSHAGLSTGRGAMALVHRSLRSPSPQCSRYLCGSPALFVEDGRTHRCPQFYSWMVLGPLRTGRAEESGRSHPAGGGAPSETPPRGCCGSDTESAPAQARASWGGGGAAPVGAN